MFKVHRERRGRVPESVEDGRVTVRMEAKRRYENGSSSHSRARGTQREKGQNSPTIWAIRDLRRITSKQLNVRTELRMSDRGLDGRAFAKPAPVDSITGWRRRVAGKAMKSATERAVPWRSAAELRGRRDLRPPPPECALGRTDRASRQ